MPVARKVDGAAQSSPVAQRQAAEEPGVSSAAQISSGGAGAPVGNVTISSNLAQRETDVTKQFQGWEIEFLATKVYSYIKHKLATERERHGRPGFNHWL